MIRQNGLVDIVKFPKFDLEIWKPPCATVELLSFPMGARETIAQLTRGYKGIYSSELPLENEIEEAYADIAKTALQTPMEMMGFVFLLTGVSRAFTHQLVRTRIGAAYVQESMRFLGHKQTYRVLITGDSLKAKESYIDVVAKAIEEYEYEIFLGIPSEDARGVLPTNIMTSVYVGYTLSTLMHVFKQRVCCQAQQGEWSPILVEMRKLIRSACGDKVAGLIKANVELGKPCGYGASFDRPCTWKNGVVEE
jgi:thymidylate synthase (FAD)